MSVGSQIRRIAALNVPVEAMREMFLVLAEQLELEESKRAVAAERQKRYRLRHNNGDNDATVTQQSRNDGVTVTLLAPVIDNLPSCLTSGKESKKDSPPSPSKPVSSYPEGFPEFWAIYPKRAGSVDRKAAVKAFGPALRRTDLKTLLWGAGKYAEFCKATGKVGTESVKQARTWLNADGWTEYQADVPGDNGTPTVLKATVFVDTPAWAEWKKVKPNVTPRDIRCEDGRIRQGWYFPSEWPPGYAGDILPEMPTFLNRLPKPQQGEAA